MNPDIQNLINSNASATTTVITLNSLTSTTIAAEQIKTDGRPNRIFFAVSNSSNNDVWLKLQAASVDDLKKGIHLPGIGNIESYWEMSDNIYKGEISAIAESGTPDVHVVEY